MLSIATTSFFGDAASTPCTAASTNELQDIANSIDQCIAALPNAPGTCDSIDSLVPLWASPGPLGPSSNYSGPINRFTYYTDQFQQLCPAERLSLLTSALRVLTSWIGTGVTNELPARQRALAAAVAVHFADPNLTLVQVTNAVTRESNEALTLTMLNLMDTLKVKYGKQLPASSYNAAVSTLDAIRQDAARSTIVRNAADAFYKSMLPFVGVPEYEPVDPTVKHLQITLPMSSTTKIVIGSIVFVGVAAFAALIAHHVAVSRASHSTVQGRRPRRTRS